ncbi:MAG: chemotaxis protein CheW [Eubacterium sp.]|nr:chemotaxis protein CheW [Eubacterium sp.]
MDEYMDAIAEVVEEKQYIVVKLGGEQYGIDIAHIDNIVRMSRITRVPKSQPYYVGVINLRGEVVPIMSLRRRFGLDNDEYSASTRIIIIRMEDQSLIGFVVDEVREVVNIDPRTIEKPTFKLDEKNASYLAGIGKNGDSLISLLDIQAVIFEKKRHE